MCTACVGYGGRVGITVGFDLDMTLIDPRPGIIAMMAVLGERSGVAIDGEFFAANLGPPDASPSRRTFGAGSRTSGVRILQ